MERSPETETRVGKEKQTDALKETDKDRIRHLIHTSAILRSSFFFINLRFEKGRLPIEAVTVID